MRLEAIEKEADLYKGEGECYIHIERANNSPIACVVSGDPGAIAQAVYTVICQLAGEMHKTVPEMLSMYKRAYKKFGVPEHRDMSDTE